MGALGIKKTPRGCLLEPPGHLLGACWGHLGASRNHLGASWGRGLEMPLWAPTRGRLKSPAEAPDAPPKSPKRPTGGPQLKPKRPHSLEPPRTPPKGIPRDSRQNQALMGSGEIPA
eukprot:7402609-Pyramimonas_sp.AAC.1